MKGWIAFIGGLVALSLAAHLETGEIICIPITLLWWAMDYQARRKKKLQEKI